MTDELEIVTLTTSDRVEVGCQLDSHFGWHNHYRMIELAVEHGFPISEDAATLVGRYAAGETNDDDDYEYVSWLMDEAEVYLNSITPEGYIWHWSEGEFFLSRLDEEGDPV